MLFTVTIFSPFFTLAIFTVFGTQRSAANPVSLLARQIPLTLVPINTECGLHDPRGRPISREMDEKIEEEFNRLLGTAAYLCHTKSMDSITLANGTEKLLSLGEVLELLIRYQEKHRVQLKVTHRKLVVKLLERKNELLVQMATERQNIEDAYERWQTASARANPCSVVTPRVEIGQFGCSSNINAVQHVSPRPDIKPDEEQVERQQVSRSTTREQESPVTPLPVYNVSAQFEVRRLLSELHEAWKKFDPLQDALNRVNRQLEILLQCPPKDVYLTDAERQTLDWHMANLEFANATELHNLSLRHWDQDDVFELSGDHCVIKEGYGAVTDALASCVTNGFHVPPCASHASGTPNAKHRDTGSTYSFGSGHIELKSSVKRVTYITKGVRVEALNAAFSQEDLIEHEADAVVCTLPLGVLKESIKHSRPGTPKSGGSKSHPTSNFTVSDLTRLTAPVFQPPLPDWKVESINRLGFGVLNKVVLFFERCFWDRSQNLFGHVSETTDKRGELYMFWSISDRPVLIALVAGRAAVDLERHTQSQISPSQSGQSVSPHRQSPGSRGVTSVPVPTKHSTHSGASGLCGSSSSNTTSSGNITTATSALQDPIVARAMQILRGIFGQDPTLNGISSSNLSDRKRTVPNIAVAASTQPASALSSQPCLFFAGEHTCRCYPATVHGALLSGLREAARIANAFFPGPTPVVDPGFKLNSNVVRSA
ncbi:unnamed protein product [Echinostoma caproni]|uniref:Amino_oxidase domain-containing protein n=1 Tax=Echinostoma caproni TaxID=27848 RepID=A0A183AML9_9TREM|nr:unnamed protein product [Echinostoma caproni]